MFDTRLLNGRTPLNLVPCLHPTKVRVHGEDMYVPCGKCAKCISAKLNVQRSLTDRLFERFKFQLFVTVTYDEQNVPKFTIDPAGNIDFINRDILPHDKLYDLASGYATLTKDDIDSIKYDVWCNPVRNYRTSEYVRYINFHDVQILTKRVLRYVKTNFPESKIAYVGCSEYGEKYLRPHFHLLFFVDSTSVLYGLVRFFKRRVQNRGVGARYKCWQFGNCHTQIVHDSAVSGYVSSYVTCNSSAPKVFRRAEFRGKFFHSANALQISFEPLIEKIRTLPVAEVVDEVLLRAVDDKERVRLWSDYNKFFRRYPNAVWFSESGVTSFISYAFKEYLDFLDSSYDSLHRYCVHRSFVLIDKYVDGKLDFNDNYYFDGYDVRKLVAYRKYEFCESVNKEYHAFLSRIYLMFLTTRHYYDLLGPDYNLSSWYYSKCVQIVESYKLRSQYSKLSLIDDAAIVDAYYAYFDCGDIDVFDDSSFMFAYYDNLLASKDKSKKINEPLLFGN